MTVSQQQFPDGTIWKWKHGSKANWDYKMANGQLFQIPRDGSQAKAVAMPTPDGLERSGGYTRIDPVPAKPDRYWKNPKGWGEPGLDCVHWDGKRMFAVHNDGRPATAIKSITLAEAKGYAKSGHWIEVPVSATVCAIPGTTPMQVRAMPAVGDLVVMYDYDNKREDSAVINAVHRTNGKTMVFVYWGAVSTGIDVNDMVEVPRRPQRTWRVDHGARIVTSLPVPF